MAKMSDFNMISKRADSIREIIDKLSKKLVQVSKEI